MARRRRGSITTTHDPQRGGDPRLVLAPSPHPTPAERRRVFMLRDGVTSVGSSESCDITLRGLDPVHAEIHHDDDDEFVLVRVGATGVTRVNGAHVDRALLRTGSRINLGAWTMSFFREEYADHGRPYGGRVGGELGRQRAQPSRDGRRGWDWDHE